MNLKLGLALGIAALAGCDNPVATTQPATTRQWTWPAIPTDRNEQAMRAAASKIQVGDSREKVIELLGTPDIDRAVYPKGRPELIGYSMYWYFSHASETLVNLNDRNINVFLTPNKKVESVDMVPPAGGQ